jgi:hypothetical protein
MGDYPTNIRKPSYPLGEEIVKSQVRTKMESGTVQSRARFTKHKHIWTLPYPVMLTVDYQILRAHFYGNIGGTFNWTFPTIASHELSGTTIVVRYVDDNLQFEWINKSYWSGSVRLEEK